MRASHAQLILAALVMAQSVAIVKPFMDKFGEFSRLHQRVCPLNSACRDKLNIQIEYNRSSGATCCGQCSCDSDCFEIGNCCLGMYKSFNHGKEAVTRSRYECQEEQFLSDSDFSFDFKRWMVSKCTVNAVNDFNKELCENPGLNGNVESLLPVSDIGKAIHYRNIFCAFCNGQFDTRDFESWDLNLYCNEVITLTDPDLLTRIEESGCNIIYQRTSSMMFGDCSYWESYDISRCNVTGLWSSYDEYIDSACQAFADPFNGTYRNYFCYLCNTRDPPERKNWVCPKDLDNIDNLSPPFFAILDLDIIRNRGEVRPELNCDNDLQFADFKLMKCRDVFCHENNRRELKTCKQEPEKVNAICYRIFIKMIPVENISVSLLDFLQSKIAGALNGLVPEFTEVIPEFDVFHKPHDVEEDIIEFLLLYLVFDFSRQTTTPKTIKVIEELHNSVISIPVEHGFIKFKSELGLYNVTVQKQYIEIHVTSPYDTNLVDILRVNLRSPDNIFSSRSCGMETIDFNKLLLCPFIELGHDELLLTLENDFLTFWRDSFIIRTFLKWEFKLTEKGILICLEDYIPISDVLLKSETLGSKGSVDKIGPKRILSFICVCMSLICLLVTIISYFLLSELRSQPGMNNLILCICLFLAQAVYQFGAGQQSLPDLACSVIGALCHLLWLSVILSMNACSLQMFLIFKSHMKISHVLNMRRTVITVLYICGGSLIFVLINLIISLVSSAGNDNGYGGNVCFINSYKMHLITFIIPSFILVAVNVGLFSYVVNRMRRFNIVSSKLNQERNYMGINARLSTLTGLTWMFGFLQILVRHDFIEYLFIFFNASQGVFIMIAFVCNHRVYSLMFKRSISRPSEGSANTEKTSVHK